MTLQHDFFRRFRPTLKATAAGLAFCTMGGLAHADFPLFGIGTQKQQTSQAEPRRLPETAPPARALNTNQQYNNLSLTAGETAPAQSGGKTEVQRQLELLYQQNGRPMPQMVNPGHKPQPQHVSEGTQRADQSDLNIFQKVFKAFNPNHQKAKRPPADPGMEYPTYAEGQTPNAPASQKPRPVPGVAEAQIPSAPPVMQPKLFDAPSAANPIAGPRTPAPAVTEPWAQQPVAQQPAPASLSAETQQFMPPKTPAAGPETQTASRSDLPKLDILAPAPETNSAVAPAEPSPTAPVANAGTASDADPFANLFPGDQPKVQPAQPQSQQQQQPVAQSLPSLDMLPSPEAEQETETAPYTGLTLEEDLFEAAEEEPETKTVSTESDPAIEEWAVTPPATPAPPKEESLAIDPRKPMPRLDLTLPEDMPKLAPAKTPQKTALEPAKQDAGRTSLAKSDAQTKLERIAERAGQPGFRGFCPVTLRDDRELVDADPKHHVIYEGNRYTFSTQAAMQRFVDEPSRYVPASGGDDVIHFALTGENLKGSLEHAVWYKGKLYMFSGVETMETFVAAPSSHIAQR